jgi:hypothetical protein
MGSYLSGSGHWDGSREPGTFSGARRHDYINAAFVPIAEITLSDARNTLSAHPGATSWPRSREGLNGSLLDHNI